MSLPPLIPRSVLFGNPERALPQISPDGRLLAFLAPVDGVLNVWLGEADGDEFVPITEDRDRGIRVYTFAPDNLHLLYLQDRGGDENWRLYSVDLATRTTVDVTPFNGVQAQVHHTDQRFPDRVIVAVNIEDPRVHDLYNLDLATGELSMFFKNPGFLHSTVLIDGGMQPRVGVLVKSDASEVWQVRDRGSDEWRDLLHVSPEDAALGDGSAAFSRDGDSVFMVSPLGGDTARLLRLDATTGRHEVLASDSRYDIAAVVSHPDTWEPQIAMLAADRPRKIVIDASIQPDVDALEVIARGGAWSLVSRDQADRTWIIAVQRDDRPIAYHLYDRASKASRLLFHDRPALLDYQLGRSEPIKFTARDGLAIEGYLTAPPGLEPRDLPLVLYVHGGPWARDVWGLDPAAQWFANRGYLSLQVNYRGSTGYGKKFLHAGDREWAGRMHDDLVDAVAWATGRGLADPQRVAIYGGSYGGYAALVGATFTPDVFCCAVDIVGPSSLETLIRSIPPYWEPTLCLWHSRVGNPDTESEFLWSRSPLSRVDDIRVPLLVAQGANDPRVKVGESEQLVAAMQAKGIAHEYLLFDDEGHGFAKPENRLRFYARAESFLGQHLGGRVEQS